AGGGVGPVGGAAEGVGAGEQAVVAIPLGVRHVAQRVGLADDLLEVVVFEDLGGAEGVGHRGDARLVVEGGRQGAVRAGGARAAALLVVFVAVPDAVAVVPAHDPVELVGAEPQRDAGGVDHRREPAALAVAAADRPQPA